MKRSAIILLLTEITAAILLILNILFVKQSNPFIISTFLVIILLVIKLLVGFEKDKNRYRKEMVMNIVIFTISYQMLIYIVGIFLGFSKTIYNLEPLSILTNIVPIAVLIILSEVTRYAFAKKIGPDNKILLLGLTTIFILLDISLKTTTFDFSNNYQLVTILALIVLPSIANNIMLTYLVKDYGYLPNIVYRLIMEVSIFLVPIIPNLGDYLSAIFLFLIPLIIMYISYKLMAKKKDKKEFTKTVESSKVSLLSRIITIIIILLMCAMIVLTSGLFKIYALSIGSGSMEPALDVGDVAVVLKLAEDEMNELQIGDILVFEHTNKVVVHRIVKIEEIDGEIKYTTKGDNNYTEDSWFVTQDMIIGKVVYSIKYIGYPTIWLNNNI